MVKQTEAEKAGFYWTIIGMDIADVNNNSGGCG
jgi:hypothetical protein